MEEDLRFDTGKAADLEADLKDAEGRIASKLDSIEKKVRSITAWWQGPAAVDEFVRNFAKSKESVDASVKKWMKEEKGCIMEAQEVMRQLDESLRIDEANAVNPLAGMSA